MWIVITIVVLASAGYLGLKIWMEHKFRSILDEHGFRLDVVRHGGLTQPHLAIDVSARRLAAQRMVDQAPMVFDMDEIVSVEATRNGSIVRVAERGRSNRSDVRLARASGKTRTLGIKIATSDMRFPSIEVMFFSNSNGVNTGSMVIQRQETEWNEWFVRLSSVLR